MSPFTPPLASPTQVLSHLKKPALLSAAQIAQRLTKVPVVILANAEGKPLTAQANDGKGVPTVGVFFRQSGATNFLEGLKKRDPALAAGIKLKVVGLGELYQRATAPGERIGLAFIPDPAEVEQARQLLKSLGRPETFSGVPLFLPEVEGKGLLNIKQEDKVLVPAFFSQAELLPVISRYNEARAPGTPAARPVLITLEFLLGAWQTTPDPALSLLQLFASKGMVDDVKALSGGT